MTDRLSFKIQHPIVSGCSFAVGKLFLSFTRVASLVRAPLLNYFVLCLRNQPLGAALEEFLIKDFLPKSHHQTDMPHDLGEYKASLCLMIPFFKDLIRKETSFY